MRKSGAMFLTLAVVLQLAAIGALIAAGSLRGKIGTVAKIYMFLLDVSTIQNTHNSTGLPDERDNDSLKDFFAIYELNYCSGKKAQGRYTINFCSAANGKELFDYTDHDWEDYGVDFLNVRGITPRRMVKRKGGGGKVGSSGGSKSSSSSKSKSKSKSKSALSPKTSKAQKVAGTKAATPVYVTTHASRFFFRIFILVFSVTVTATLLGIAAIWFYWCSILAGLFCWLAMFASIALAADPKDYVNKFNTFLKKYKGPNGTTVSIKLGTTPILILWIMFTMLVLSSIAWLFCFFLLLPKSKPKTVDATHDEEANNTEEDRDFDIKQDVRVQTAPVVSSAPAKGSFITRIKTLPVSLMSMRGKKAQRSDYEPVQNGGGSGNSMQQDTSYVSPGMGTYASAPTPAYMQQSHTHAAYEPMRVQ